jgi:hypothetical protein
MRNLITTIALLALVGSPAAIAQTTGSARSRASGRRGIGSSILFESWQDEMQTQSLLRPAPGSNISRGEFSDALVDPGSDFRNCS